LLFNDNAEHFDAVYTFCFPQPGHLPHTTGKDSDMLRNACAGVAFALVQLLIGGFMPGTAHAFEGNLAPDEAQLANGRTLIGFISPALTASSLLPSDLKKMFGFELIEYRREVKGEQYYGNRIYYKAQNALPLGGTGVDYKIQWGFKSNTIIYASLNVNDKAACITESMLQAKLGKGERSMSTMRHFSPGQVPPPRLASHSGLRYIQKWRDISYIYFRFHLRVIDQAPAGDGSRMGSSGLNYGRKMIRHGAKRLHMAEARMSGQDTDLHA
jgi:hypothetical protein